jgi:hypothetical protein
MPSGKNTEVTQLHTVKKKMAKWNELRKTKPFPIF